MIHHNSYIRTSFPKIRWWKITLIWLESFHSNSLVYSSSNLVSKVNLIFFRTILYSNLNHVSAFRAYETDWILNEGKWKVRCKVNFNNTNLKASYNFGNANVYSLQKVPRASKRGGGIRTQKVEIFVFPTM